MLCTGYDFLAGNPPSADLVYHWACLPRKHTMLYCTCRLQEDKSIMYKDIANELLSFIQKSPSCFHAVNTMKDMLLEAGKGRKILHYKKRLQSDRLPHRKQSGGLPLSGYFIPFGFTNL